MKRKPKVKKIVIRIALLILITPLFLCPAEVFGYWWSVHERITTEAIDMIDRLSDLLPATNTDCYA